MKAYPKVFLFLRFQVKYKGKHTPNQIKNLNFVA